MKKPIEYYYLLNSLVLFSSDFEYLKSLDSPNFDIEFELGSDFELGFDQSLLDRLLSQKIINLYTYSKIIELKEYILAIPDSFWTIEELESNSIWNSVRENASEILNLLGEGGIGYNFSIIRIIE